MKRAFCVLGMLALCALSFVSFGLTAEGVLACVASVVACAIVDNLLHGKMDIGFSSSLRGQIGVAGDVETAHKELMASLSEVKDKLKSNGETLLAGKQATDELKAETDKLLKEQADINSRLRSAEQLLASGQGGAPARVLSLGEQVVSSAGFVEGLQALQKGGKSISATVDISAAITGADVGFARQIKEIKGPGNPAKMRLRDLLASGSMDEDNAITYPRETLFTNNAASVRENPSDPKPESQLVIEMQNASVDTIAHWIRASKQVLSDVKMLQSYINGRLLRGLEVNLEDALLNSTGAGTSIDGLINQASAYSPADEAGVTNVTMIDRLRLAMLQVELAEELADGIVLTPSDWAKIVLLKDGQNQYLIANPLGTTQEGLWGIPVVTSVKMDQSQFLVGAFKTAAQLWMREEATILVSTEDRDNFVKNMVTILAELRAALTVYRPQGFVTGSTVIASA